MALLDHTSSNMSRHERKLRRELKDLRSQIARLSRSVGDVGHGVYVDASADAKDFFKGVRKRAGKARPFWRKKERAITEFAVDYPFTMVTAIAGAGLLAAAIVAWSIERDH